MKDLKTDNNPIDFIPNEIWKSVSRRVGVVYFNLLSSSANGQKIIDLDKLLYPDEYWVNHGLTAEQVEIIVNELESCGLLYENPKRFYQLQDYQFAI